MNDIYVGSLFSEAYLEHHGIKGMHWGVRRFQREDGSLTSAGKKRKLVNEHKNESEKKPGALKRAGHKALGKVYELNEKAYNKLGNKTLASMNKAAKEEQYKKAGYEGNSKRPETLKAKSSDSAVTKRVKNDYNNLSDDEFKGKYQTTKDVYAKRVEKYGDPYKNSPLAKTGKALEKAGKTASELKSNAQKGAGELASNAAGKVKSGIKEGAARAYDSSIIGRYAQENVKYWDKKNSIERGIDNIKAAKKRKTLGGKMSELVGAGAKKRYYQNEANVQRALANKAYKSSKNKAEAERNARNSEQQAKYFDSVNKGKTKDTLRGRFNIPYEKANGKTTTRGKKYISDVSKRALKKGAVKVGKAALGAALTYAANKAASKNYNVLEVQTLEDFSRRK